MKKSMIPSLMDKEAASGYYAARAALMQAEYTRAAVADIVKHVFSRLACEPGAVRGVDLLETPSGKARRLPALVSALVQERAPEILEAVSMEVCYTVNQLHKLAMRAGR